MARFYRTSQTQQVDYTLDPRLYKGLSDMGGIGNRSASQSQKKGVAGQEVSVIPDDIPFFQEVQQEYKQEVDGIMGKLRQNMSNPKIVEQDIARLRQKAAIDQQPGGRLYAFGERAKQYNDYIKQAGDTFKEDRDLYEFAINRVDVGEMPWDANGAPTPVRGSFTKPWTQKDEQDFLKTAKTTITPKMLQDAERLGIDVSDMNKYKNFGVLATRLGYTKEDAYEHIANTMSPEMLRQMQFQWEYDKSRGRAKGDTFESYMAEKVDGYAEALSGVTSSQMNVLQSDTDAAINARVRASAAGRPRTEETSIDDFSPQVGAMVTALQNPTGDLLQAINRKEDKVVPIQELSDVFNNVSFGGNLQGTPNIITEVGFNPKKGKFMYKSLYDLRTQKRKDENEADNWVELSTSTINVIGQQMPKFRQAAFVNAMNKMGVLNPNQQFDWGKVLNQDEDDDGLGGLE